MSMFNAEMIKALLEMNMTPENILEAMASQGRDVSMADIAVVYNEMGV